MIVGSGVDIVEVERIKRAVRKWGSNFIDKIFTKNELAYSHEKKYTYQHLAARFATKEAVLKAFGGGWLRTLPWKEIEIINDQKGKPNIKLHGEARQLKNRKKIHKIVISISHTRNYAVASAILER